MEEIKWEAPAPAKRGGYAATKSAYFVEAGKSRPNQWFVLYEGTAHRPAWGPFKGPQWERAYRRTVENGVKIQRTYIRYIGN